MSRVSKSALYAKIDWAANTLKAADKNEKHGGQVSWAERNAMLASLDGYEKGVFALFTAYMNHGDQHSITFKDIDHWAAKAKAEQIDRLDVNHNGLSKAELANGSRTVKLIDAWIVADAKAAKGAQ
jgi:hypothetical protein